jgi:hypothetical protein
MPQLQTGRNPLGWDPLEKILQVFGGDMCQELKNERRCVLYFCIPGELQIVFTQLFSKMFFCKMVECTCNENVWLLNSFLW